MISDKFVLLGAAINLFGGLVYFKDTLSGETRPNRVTWGLWAVPGLIAFAAEVKAGVGLQSLFTLMIGAGPLVIFITTFVKKNYVWRLGKFDYICGGLSLLGVALWLITKQGNLAIIFSILADAMAALPTVIKSIKYPQTESALAYLTTAISALITIATIKTWSLAEYGFPLYTSLICLFIFGLVQFKLGKRIISK